MAAAEMRNPFPQDNKSVDMKVIQGGDTYVLDPYNPDLETGHHMGEELGQLSFGKTARLVLDGVGVAVTALLHPVETFREEKKTLKAAIASARNPLAQ